MKKVIVIGGGVSGLSAARHLVNSKKFDVKLLEADTKIGGRVHTKSLGDYFIENGAQWIHGEDGNAVFQMAQSLNLINTESGNFKVTMDTAFVTNTGRLLDQATQDRMTVILERILEGPEENEIEGTLGAWAKEKFNEEFKSCPLETDGVPINAAVLDWIHRFQNSIDGADNWFQTSLRGQHEYWECEGNPTVSWKGPACYASFLSVILSGTPTLAPVFQPEIPDWIELGKEVRTVELLELEAAPVRVTCADNSQFTCDHLICTVSLGVLKHFHKSLFNPPLPESKVRVIENLGIGCVNKLHFDFKRKWWPDSVIGYSFLWEDAEHVEEYWRSDIDEATLKKEIDGIPLWCRNILGFYVVASHPTALNSWISGPAAILIEKMTDEEVKATFMKVLKRFVVNEDIPEPVEFCQSSWFTNPFTKGSYSFRQMKSEKEDIWSSDLGEPIVGKSGDPAICFAGEATHSHYYSTVHGAYESGLREANRLIALKG